MDAFRNGCRGPCAEEPISRMKTDPHLHAITISDVVARRRDKDGECAGVGAIVIANGAIEDFANLGKYCIPSWFVTSATSDAAKYLHTAHARDAKPEQQEGVDADCDVHINVLDHLCTCLRNA